MNLDITRDNTFEIDEVKFISFLARFFGDENPSLKLEFDEEDYKLIVFKENYDSDLAIYHLFIKETQENQYYASLTALALSEEFTQ